MSTEAEQLTQEITITLTRVQLILLHEALAKVSETEWFDEMLGDAEKLAFLRLEGDCERLNDDAFLPEYETIVENASRIFLGS